MPRDYAEGKPVADPLPDGAATASNQTDGSQKTQVVDPTYQQSARISPAFRHAGTYTHIRLTGGNFIGSTLETDQWAETTANGGTVTVSGGFADLSTSTSTNGSAVIESIRDAKLASFAENTFVGGIRLATSGVSGATRRWGVFDANNGFFFEYADSTFSLVRRKAGTDTSVTVFNGEAADFNPDDNNWHAYEIVYSMEGAYFLADGDLIHTMTVTDTLLTDNLDLRIRLECTKTSGATDVSLEAHRAACARLGEMKRFRLDEPIEDEDLVLPSRSVIAAKHRTSGSYVDISSDEVTDSVANPTAGLDILGFTMGWDEDTLTWNRIRSRQPVDSMTNPGKALNVAGFSMLWTPGGSPNNRWNRQIGSLLSDGMADQLAALTAARLQYWNGTGWDRATGDTGNGLDVDVTRSALPTGAATLAEQQDANRFGDTAGTPSTVSVTTSATLVHAANTDRKAAFIRNPTGLANPTVFIGYTNSITTANAPISISPGEFWEETTSRTAIYAIVAAGTATVAKQEVTT